MSKEIEAVFSLKENWDCYGSPAPSDKMRIQYNKIICTLEKNDIPAAHTVFPVCGGGIQLEWWKYSFTLMGNFAKEVEIELNGVRMRALRTMTEENGEILILEEYENLTIGDIPPLIEWLRQ